MAAALVFLVGQLFLLGITSGQTTPGLGCPEPCSDCKEFPDGEYEGTWYLKADIDQRCPDRCLYQRESDRKEMCFCDPGTIKYDTCCDNHTVNITNALSVYTEGQVIFDDDKCDQPPIDYGGLAPGATTIVSFPCTCYITNVTAETIDVPSQNCTTYTTPGTQIGTFEIVYTKLPECEVTWTNKG